MENRNLPRDVFLYLLAIVTLGMLAVNFGMLLFQFVNIALPDPVAARYQYWSEAAYQQLRWAVASLVIVVPVFLWVSRFLNQDIAAHPEKRELKIRKWLLYLTLFVAGVVGIGDLIALVYNFLQGELTLRFVLKVLSILAIAGSVFYYYLTELRETRRSLTWFVRTVIVVLVAGLVAGFVMAGSPQAQRQNRFDDQRLQDLQGIQWQIVSYWQAKQKLPPTLDALNDDLNGYRVPTDPESGTSYQYYPALLSFQLCAIFKASNQEVNPGMPKPIKSDVYLQGESNWAHDAGEVCFERTIDPDRFPPVNNKL